MPYDLRHTGATLIDERKDRETTSKALGHVVAGGGSITAGYIHTRLVTVDSTVLDEALSETDSEVSAEPEAGER